MNNIKLKHVVATVIVAAVVVIGCQYALAQDKCETECGAIINEDLYNQCIGDCRSRSQASMVDRLMDTQLAWGDYCGNGCADVDPWDMPACKSYCSSNNRAGLDGDIMTAFKESRPESININVDLGDMAPTCVYDAFACFNLASNKKETQMAGVFGR